MAAALVPLLTGGAAIIADVLTKPDGLKNVVGNVLGGLKGLLAGIGNDDDALNLSSTAERGAMTAVAANALGEVLSMKMKLPEVPEDWQNTTRGESRTAVGAVIEEVQNKYDVLSQKLVTLDEIAKDKVIAASATAGAPHANIFSDLSLNTNINALSTQTAEEHRENARLQDTSTSQVLRSLKALTRVPNIADLSAQGGTSLVDTGVVQYLCGAGTANVAGLAPAIYLQSQTADGVRIATSGSVSAQPFRWIGGDVPYAGVAPSATLQGHIDAATTFYDNLLARASDTDSLAISLTGTVKGVRKINNLAGQANYAEEKLEGDMGDFIEGTWTLSDRSAEFGTSRWVLPCRVYSPEATIATRTAVTQTATTLSGTSKLYTGGHRVFQDNLPAVVEYPLENQGCKSIETIIVAVIFSNVKSDELKNFFGGSGRREARVAGVFPQTYRKTWYKAPTPYNNFDKIDTIGVFHWDSEIKGVAASCMGDESIVFLELVRPNQTWHEVMTAPSFYHYLGHAHPNFTSPQEWFVGAGKFGSADMSAINHRVKASITTRLRRDLRNGFVSMMLADTLKPGNVRWVDWTLPISDYGTNVRLGGTATNKEGKSFKSLDLGTANEYLSLIAPNFLVFEEFLQARNRVYKKMKPILCTFDQLATSQVLGDFADLGALLDHLIEFALAYPGWRSKV